MKQEDLQSVNYLIMDRSNMADWIRSINRELAEPRKYVSGHKEALDWLLNYRSKELLECMLPLLTAMLENTEKAIVKLGLEVRPERLEYRSAGIMFVEPEVDYDWTPLHIKVNKSREELE